MRIRLPIIGILLIGILMLAGCNDKDGENIGPSIYYINIEGTKVLSSPYKNIATDTESLIAEYIEQLSTQSDKAELKCPIGPDVVLNSYDYRDGLLVLDFDKSYANADPIYEVLRRAAIVRTLTQIEGVDGVMFLEDGTRITDSKQQEIGVMTSDTFVENTGAEINTYEKAQLRLYFTDSEGDNLVSYVEEVVYNSNISLDKLIVEHLVKGPIEEGFYPVIQSDVQILGVTTRDGTCYVNFGNEFLTKSLKISDKVILYSFVNSLTELPNVSRVQFMIDSETDMTFGDNISLSEPFERNLDIVEGGL